MSASVGPGGRSVGRALSPMGASLLIHAALLLALVLARPAAGPEAPAGPPAVLFLATARPAAAAGTAAVPDRLVPGELPVAAEVPLPAAFRDLPDPATPAGPPVAPRVLAVAGGTEQPVRPGEPGELPTPDFEALLAQAPPPGYEPAGEEGSPPAREPATGQAVAALVADERSIEWSGQPRRVLVRKDPRFPRRLVQEGQEAEVTARFTVSADGQVSNVVILRSSGDTLVETEVRQALNGWLLEKSASGQPETATISFRFRLER